MEGNQHMDSALWRDRFENEVTYCLSEEHGVSSIDLGSIGSEIALTSMLVKTSGSSGKSKWVVHSKLGLLNHAAMVNEHLGIKMEDILGLMIPIYHVGGLGIIARALVSGAHLVSMETKWSARSCVDFIQQHQVSVLSLVPTQLVDLVTESLAAPRCLRVVVVGGGRLDSQVRDKAIALGWPVLESYGMSETGSQIATGSLGEFIVGGFLKIIDGWKVRLNDVGVLEVKGDCLFKGYLFENHGEFEFIDPKVDGWFTTSDKVDLLEMDGKMGIKFLSRNDQSVKILGELVDVSDLETKLTKILQREAYIIPLANVRRGMKLVPVVEHVDLADKIRDLNYSGLHQLEEPVVITHFPRNTMGKLQRDKLAELVESIVISAD